MYQLKEGVYLIQGALNGALLDTNSGNVYSINSYGCKVLTGEVSNEPYWEKLEQLGLAENVEKTNKRDLPNLQQAPSLGFVWFEIVTGDCNERCVHCYTESMPKSQRKKGDLAIPLKVLEAPKPKMTHSDWLKAIKEAFDLGCRKCQFIGGEPFMYIGDNKETVLDLATYCVQLGYEIVEIYTNATLLTPEKIKVIKDLGLKVAVSVYSINPEVHDAITRTPGSHAKTMKSLQMLKDLGVPTRVEVVLMKGNEHTILETLEWRTAQGFGGKNPDPLRPKGRGDNPLLQPSFSRAVTYGFMLRPNFSVSKSTLAHYLSGHSCLMGKITITETGDVLPCIFSRNQILGTIGQTGDLTSIVTGESVQKMWNTTKDSVMVCKDCEYRYVCFDCRPLSEGYASGRADYLSAPYPRCTHNPYTGEWAQGLWRVDLDGKPYYDRQRAPEIQEALANYPAISNEETGH